MKFLLALSITFFLLYACQSDSNENDGGASISHDIENTAEAASESDSILYKSTETGTTEHMKMKPSENGNREWYYWSEKKGEEVKLGVKTIDGLEAVYFYAEPNKLYEIVPSECGFTLFLGETRLQWYEQIEPSCERPY